MFKTIKNNIFIKLFNSIPTAIIILCMITAACIAGTLIPQNRGSAFYFQTYGDKIFNLITIFSLDNLYHSIWFISLLIMLCLNIIICTFTRIKPLFKAAKINDPVISESLIETIKLKKEKILTADANTENQKNYISNICQIINNSFKLKNYNTFTADKSEKIFIMARRGEYSFIGVVLVHLSVLIILFGAISGNLYGFKNYITLFPGQEFNIPTLECYRMEQQVNNLIEKMQFLKIDMRPEIAELMKKRKELLNKSIFEARVEDFKTEYIKTSSTSENYVKNWFTTLAVLNSDEVCFTQEISVNNPLSYKGIEIYQSSYGTDPESGKEYTGLQINYDPGVNFIWAGSILMTIGLFITFNFYNRKIFTVINAANMNISSVRKENIINKKTEDKKCDASGNKIIINFYAVTNKNHIAFEREFNDTINNIISELETLKDKKAEI